MIHATDTATFAVDDIATLARGWQLSLRARNRSPQTIRGYLKTLELFRDFLVLAGMPTEVAKINRDHVETFVADQLEKWKPKTAQVRYGDVRQFFNWCVEEGEITTHPMAKMKPPVVPETPVPVVGVADLKKLFKTAEGTRFENRRDTAILRLFLGSGLRLAELTHLAVDDVDFDLAVVGVLGKGRRPRGVPFDNPTAQALERYLRARAKHDLAKSDGLWLGSKGPMTDSGVAEMLRRRCDDAGIDRIHPHQLRHTSVHGFLELGGCRDRRHAHLRLEEPHDAQQVRGERRRRSRTRPRSIGSPRATGCE